MKWQTAKLQAEKITGRTPRWCNVRDDNDDLAPAPTPESMDDCIAFDENGNQTPIEAWLNEKPCGEKVEAVCYF